MKKFRIFVLTILSVLAIVAVCMLGACVKKPTISVRIFYETNGGSEIGYVVGEVGSSYIAPEAPEFEGYEFAGWYLDAEFKTAFTANKFPKTDTTLYAKWNESNEYAYITFYGNGVLLQKTPVKKGEALTEPDLFSVNEIYTGWYTDAEMKAENAYTISGNATESLALYTAFYTKGLKIDDGTVTEYTPSTANISTIYVPNVIDGVKVTAIGDDAFVMSAEINVISKIVLPDTITTIGERAFYDCRYLTSVNVSKNVTSIGKYAFYQNIRLTDIGDISSVTEIAEGTFLGCESLAKVTLSADLTSIGDQAFADCKNLTEITIPAGTEIGKDAFKGTSFENKE